MRSRIVEIDEIKDRRITWLISISAALLIIGCLAGLYFAFQIENVVVEGNAYYSDEQIRELVIDSPKKEHTVYLWLSEKLFGHNDIAFIDRYNVKVTGLHSVRIVLYEKDIIGCFEQMGTYMYFNNKGTVIECGSKLMEGIPLITGVQYKSAVLYGHIDVPDDTVFSKLMNIGQILERNEITADRIHFDTSLNAVIYVGDIKVVLGNNNDTDGQIRELKNILPKLEGSSGTVNLSYYSKDKDNPYYPFTYD